MTTTTRNEAAERLRETLREDSWAEDALAMVQLDDALAAERRATVERLENRLADAMEGYSIHPDIIQEWFDEEKAR